MTRSSLLLLCWLVATCGDVRAAGAAELTVPFLGRSVKLDVLQSLITEYHWEVETSAGNAGDRHADFKNRSELILTYGSTTLDLRLDVNAFVGTPDVSKHENRATLEKASINSLHRHIDLTGGDFYVRLGRGLAIDLTRISQLYHDTTLRGAQVRLRSPWISGTAFGGWVNPLEVDDPTEVPIQAPSDIIAGAQVEVRPHRSVALAGHYVGASLEKQSGPRDQSHTIGGSLELPNLLGRFALYGELDYVLRPSDAGDRNGMGTYASATGSLGPLTLLVEFRYYRRLLFSNAVGPEAGDILVYNRPPVLTRPEQEVSNNHDVIGPRARLDLRLGRWGTVLYGSYGWFYNSFAMLPDDGFFDKGGTGMDIFGGVQQPFSRGALDVSGGYRLETHVDETTGEQITDYSQAFAKLELSLAAARGHSAELHGEYRKIDKVTRSYSDCFVSLGYRPSKYFAASVTYEHSTELASRQHFYSATATVNFTSQSFVRLFGGSTRGGMRCVDGFCRELPAFVGGKLELVFQI